MKVAANRLDRGFQLHQKEYEEKALEVLRSGYYILGNEVKRFEEEFASYTGAKYCVGVANGLDALWMAFRIMGIGQGDEVIVQANTYIASVMGISMNGATPILVEPDEYYNLDVNQIEDVITKRTKAILVVHLYGQASNMTAVMEIARKYNLRVVEDCAQSHGAYHNGHMTGTFGDIGCFSFYPSKNLGAFGDAGAMVTNDPDLAEKARVFRNYGSEKRYYNRVVGTNSRLDEMQAGLLRVRLKHLAQLQEERVKICSRYLKRISNDNLILPTLRENCTTVWHQFVVRCKNREKFIEYLNAHEIGTIIHYPIPPHRSEAYQYLGLKEGSYPITEQYAKEVLSLPLYNGMKDEELDYIIEVINNYKG